MLKRLIMLALTVPAATLAWVTPAHATYYTLVSCDFKFVPEYGRNVYIGTYRSQYGNLFTKSFTSYCPASISD